MTAGASTRPLRICMIAQKFPILGRASDQGFLWPIARGLAKLGHDVTVLSAKSKMGKPDVSRDGVQLYFLHDGFHQYIGTKFENAAYDKFLHLHQEKPFDLVHSIDR